MREKNLLLIAGGLSISLLIAFFLSPYASSFPDGLEKVAEELGFIDKGGSIQPWESSPAPDYALKGVGNEKLSTGLAGLVGTVSSFILAICLGYLLKKKKHHPRKSS
jgi:cobalt/nickel transport protein